MGLWPSALGNMEIKNILVTGSEGYIGTILVDLLIKKGYQVTGLDSCYYSNNRNLKKNYRLLKKDIRKIGEINSNTSYFISNLTVYIAKVRDKATFKKLSDEESNKISNGRWYSIKEVKGMIRKNKIFCALTLAALSMAFCNLKTQK